MDTNRSDYPEHVKEFLSKDPYNFAMKLFCKRWKPFLIKAISCDEFTRFARFTKQLPISEKVLAQNLRELEADGLVMRTVYAEVPPRVEYRLTELGYSICPILNALYDWGREEMKKRKLPIDREGEIWHGYQKRNETIMQPPFSR
ncbi:winged helix-turn-helix transcriptional regulator [Sporomusa aerivorans]|uniref:winged helix-turn-helix transcriptional regulator n=1 Tax=Sporomusa aerivorans TaxID=204936 RepID=UPI00352ADB3D